jgi:hypothetical protein
MDYRPPGRMCILIPHPCSFEPPPRLRRCRPLFAGPCNGWEATVSLRSFPGIYRRATPLQEETARADYRIPVPRMWPQIQTGRLQRGRFESSRLPWVRSLLRPTGTPGRRDLRRSLGIQPSGQGYELNPVIGARWSAARTEGSGPIGMSTKTRRETLTGANLFVTLSSGIAP